MSWEDVPLRLRAGVRKLFVMPNGKFVVFREHTFQTTAQRRRDRRTERNGLARWGNEQLLSRRQNLGAQVGRHLVDRLAHWL